MTKRVGVYELGKVLGEGSFGKVRMATHTKTKENYAMKLIEKEKIKREDLIESLKKEISILMMIDHPNIVKLKEVLASKTKIYLVLEFIEGGELWNKIKDKGKIEEEELRRIFRQIIRALDYCKIKNIAHRDLKPENILLDNAGNAKVSDFGLSSLYRDPSNLTQLLHTTCGTINYLAPEVIQNQGYDGHMADVWSLGVILYFCASGTLPFEDENVGRLLEKIVSANYEMQKNFSKNLKDLIKGILHPNPKKRTTLAEIKNHAWFLENITPEEIKWLTEQEEKFQIKDSSRIFSVNFESFEEHDIHLATEGSLAISPKHFLKEKDTILIPASPLSPKQGPKYKARKLNAFELMNFLSGCLINRIFDVDLKNEYDYDMPLKIQKELSQEKGNKNLANKKIEHCQNFTVNKNLKEIYNSIMTAFRENQPIDVAITDPEIGLRLVANFKEKNNSVSVACEVFELYENLYLVYFSKADGSLKLYLRIFQKIFEKIPSSLFL